MARQKELSASDIAELVAYASDDATHDIVWRARAAVNAGVDGIPTLADIAAVARLGTALHIVADALTMRARREAELVDLKAQLRAEMVK